MSAFDGAECWSKAIDDRGARVSESLNEGIGGAEIVFDCDVYDFGSDDRRRS